MRSARLIAQVLLLTLAAASTAALAGSSTVAFAAGPKMPRTVFEQTKGASWTPHEDELKFLAEVDRLSERVEIDTIGKTAEGRPLQLVRLGYPYPDKEPTHDLPTTLFVCSQHGNEPAGREACLMTLRDLAFTNEGRLLEQLYIQRILFVPSANPDGRAANTRENSAGVDINRDHLNLVSPEAQAVAKVVRDWRPDFVLDLHEYGPSTPPVYDDDLLYLWPRNLNVDDRIHDLAHKFANDWVEPRSEEEGYSADEYGQYELADQDVHQTAGDGDEGIARNAMGLRHSLGILIETAVTADPRNGPDEVTTEAELNRRRVASHMFVSNLALEFMWDIRFKVDDVTSSAWKRAAAEGRDQMGAVYFGGADNQEPTDDQIVDPPPCSYTLTKQQLGEVDKTLKLLGIMYRPVGNGAIVPMGQPMKTLIPLLLDERGLRHSVAAKANTKC
jgi:hypothetical protein